MADIDKSAAGPRAVAGRRLTRVLLAAAISALSLALLIGLVDRASLAAAVGKLSPSAIALASALFFLSLALRGCWLRLLAPGGVSRPPLAHWVRLAASRADCTAGISKAIRMPIMAITTSSSMSVNAARRFCVAVRTMFVSGRHV